MSSWRVFSILLLGIVALSGFAAGNEIPDGDIRGGNDVTEIIPWYVVFADTTLCGGVLVRDTVSMSSVFIDC